MTEGRSCAIQSPFQNIQLTEWQSSMLCLQISHGVRRYCLLSQDVLCSDLCLNIISIITPINTITCIVKLIHITAIIQSSPSCWWRYLDPLQCLRLSHDKIFTSSCLDIISKILQVHSKFKFLKIFLKEEEILYLTYLSFVFPSVV